VKPEDLIDEALFSVALQAYRRQGRASGGVEQAPSKATSSQEGNVVVLRNAHRELLARYRVLERGGGLGFKGPKSET
jgi:hypothetical protein